jgi:CheY-like chemotaxis protein
MRERIRVLIVDDEELMRELVGDMLPKGEFSVSMADGGPSALAAIAADPPDLVLLDLNMPKMTGWQVIDRLKALPTAPPIIAMSGMGTAEPVGLQAVRRYVVAYLPKPFNREQLKTTCLRAIEAARTSPIASSAAAEKRKEPRRNLLVATTLMSPEGTPAAVGQILNLSPSGAQIDLGASLQPGMVLTLGFEIPGGQGPFRVKGRIQWTKDGKLGVSFVDVNEADHKRLEELLAIT